MADAPCEVWFYHLERSSLEQVLPELLEKTLARHWRALVLCSSVESAESLDGWLWTYRDESFLPHGLAGEPMADRQPVLVTTTPANLNAAHVLFALGADPGALEAYGRCIIVFDGRDEEALQRARTSWRRYKAAGHSVAYWQQGERGWEKRA